MVVVVVMVLVGVVGVVRGEARAGEAGDGELAACVAAAGAVADFEGEGEGGGAGGERDTGCDGLAGAGEGEGCGGHCWNYVSCVFLLLSFFFLFMYGKRCCIASARDWECLMEGMVGKGWGFGERGGEGNGGRSACVTNQKKNPGWDQTGLTANTVIEQNDGPEPSVSP